MSQSGRASSTGGGGSGDLETLTGDLGGAVSPQGNNIDIVGDQTTYPSIVVVGDNGTATLQINTVGRSYQYVQTTNATPTALTTIALDPNSVVTAFVEICAANAAFSAGAAATVLVGARRAGAGAIIINSPVINILDDFGSAISVNVAVVGNDMDIVVTGIAATTINWKALTNLVFYP